MKYEPYEYQFRCIRKISEQLKIHNKVLLYLPTGGGKTVIGQYITEKVIGVGKTVLFTVPREKLAKQTIESFGFGNLIQGSNTRDNNSLCTVGTLQSIYSRKDTTQYDYIIIDECHFASESKYMKYLLQTNTNAKIIGVSATPIDENGYLLQGYDSIVSEVTVNELVSNGYLTPIKLFTALNPPKTDKISIVNGDYNMTEASEVVSESKVIQNVFEEWKRLSENRKTIVFACDINHAEKLTDIFKDNGYSASCVHSKVSQKEIQKRYQDFKEGAINVLINVDMATFGFDEPSIECMLFARPIKSLRLYKQMVGRGVRASISTGKKDCIMIDAGNVVFDNGMPLDELVFVKKPVVSKRLDNQFKIERTDSGEIDYTKITKERIEYLQEVSSMLDLYATRKYSKEQELVDDVKIFLKRLNYFNWRQNSGKAFIEKRWVTFTDKNGLPDITLIYHGVYIGLELKLPSGRLTKHQKETLPEMLDKNITFFFIESVMDLFNVLDHLKENIVRIDDNVIVKNSLFLMDQQSRYLKKYKLI